MKQILRSIAVAAFGFAALNVQAQLADGSIAPNFTITDTNGNTHTLYDYLDEGKTVIIDLFAVWCGPCWNYHQTGTGHPNAGALKDAYNMYGPNGTDELMVFAIEADPSTAPNTIFGGGNSIGDWVTGTPYPMANDDQIADLYDLAFYPTIFTICPNRVLQLNPSQPGAAVYQAQAQACPVATAAVDASAVEYTGSIGACGSDPIDFTITLQNMGLQPLTAATITATGAGVNLSYNWTGNLGTYAMTEVNIGSASVNSDAPVQITVTASGDANATNNTVMASGLRAVESTSLIKVVISTDCWGEEVSWSIVNTNNNTTVFSVAENTLDDLELYEWYVSVPSTGCYRFILEDGFGDGLQGSLYSQCGVDGFAQVMSIDDNLQISSWIYGYDGSYEYDEETASFETVTINVGVSEEEFAAGTMLFPNPANVSTNLVFGLATAAHTTVDIINITGQRVMSFDYGVLPAGEQRFVLDLSELSAGLYMVNINAGAFNTTKRLTVSK
ncbi:MAG: T9SS type A sorting domain-containing protein [Flavobacteriales bacterium]